MIEFISRLRFVRERIKSEDNWAKIMEEKGQISDPFLFCSKVINPGYRYKKRRDMVQTSLNPCPHLINHRFINISEYISTMNTLSFRWGFKRVQG